MSRPNLKSAFFALGLTCALAAFFAVSFQAWPAVAAGAAQFKLRINAPASPGGGGGGGGGYIPPSPGEITFSGLASPESAVALLRDGQYVLERPTFADGSFQLFLNQV